jgi:AraC-like DNA-binding protein
MRGACVPVIGIALEIGYDRASWFITLFRRTLGTTPRALHRGRVTINVILPSVPSVEVAWIVTLAKAGARPKNQSLSKILCVRHNMSQRSMYATQTEGGRCGREGIAINS